jgi:tripartite-type tricarboxylate transporter receptor subunit TctC
VPSVAESGLPGFDFSPGVGILLRAGTPMHIVNKLYQDVLNVLRLPDVKQRLSQNGAEIVGSSPQAFSAYIEDEIAKWAKVVKASGLRADGT